MTSVKEKVVIIGGGPAGLTAAYELLKKNSTNYEVIIIEKESMVGGISKTINYNGYRMDLGGHRFFTKDKQVQQIWEELMPIQGKPSKDDIILNNHKNFKENGSDPENEDESFLIRNRVSRIYYKGKFFDYPVKFNFETIKKLGFIDTMISGFSYLKSLIIKKKETNLENFYINRFGKKLYSIFFRDYTEKLWGRSPSEIDASWGSQRVKGISIKEVLKDSFSKILFKKSKSKETSLIEEFYYPKYGPGQMYQLMSKKVIELGGTILLNSEVKKINYEKNRIKSVVIKSKSGKLTIDGDIFISSMPIKDITNYMDNIPNKVKRISNGLPYRDFITIGLVLKQLKLKNKTSIKTVGDIVPDCWIYVQSKDVKLGRIQIFNNWSPYMLENLDEEISIGLEYFCTENDDFWNMKNDELKSYAVNELIKMNVISGENDVINYHVERVEKAYPAYFDTYKDFDIIKKYLSKFDNLYCVGRNGQHRYNNMDHSMLTSIKTVEAIIAKTDKDIIWNVNTESEYHEEKKK